MQINEVFDASQIAPQQGGGKHPVGNKWDFQITHTAIEETKDKTGGMFVVTFTSQVGQIVARYNIWNPSEQTRKIAQGQLSALCHAIGIFQIQFATEGANIRGARCKGDVGFQSGHEPTAEKPEGGYVELKKVYDMNGNEPGKAGNVAQQPTGQQNFQPQQQTVQQPQQNVQQNQPQVQNGWNNGGGQPQQQQPVNNNTSGGWQQNASGAAPQAPWKQG